MQGAKNRDRDEDGDKDALCQIRARRSTRGERILVGAALTLCQCAVLVLLLFSLWDSYVFS